MIAIDRDPTQSAPAERLADLYREKGDSKALAALLERRAKALGGLTQQDREMAAYVASLHQELGRLWQEAPLSNASKAIENYRRAIELDPGDAYSIYAVREALKAAGQGADAVPYFAMEQALIDDPERRVALYQDEAEVRRDVGDIEGAIEALRDARRVDPEDAGLMQQLGTMVLELIREGKKVDENAKAEGAELFAHLAGVYPGEHGLAYSTCALEVVPGHDRGMQLAIYYGEQLGRLGEVATFAASYLEANPSGVMADEARKAAGDAKARSAVAAPRPEPKPADKGAVKQAAAEQTIDDVEPVGVDDDEGEAEQEGPSLSSSELDNLVTKAQKLAAKNRRNEAAGVYMQVLEAEPSHPEALGYLQTYLRQTRKYAQLRDVLLRAADGDDDKDARLGHLREAAGICETQLRDWDSAIAAWQRIAALDPSGGEPREQLRRLMERAQKWDDLVTLLEQEAEMESDLENRLVLEKQLAKLHEVKRKDPAGAGEAWARIATLTPGDETAIHTAVRFFDKGERPDLAAQVIADNVGGIEDGHAKGQLYKRLAELRSSAGDKQAAGEAFAEGAAALKDAALWEEAEKCFVEVEAWEQAATAINERSELEDKPKQKAALLATEATYLQSAGDGETALVRLEQATELDPTSDEYAEKLEAGLEEAERTEDLAQFLLSRAEKLADKDKRIALRKRAAELQKDTLGDAEAARETFELILADGDDPGALSALSDDAEERGEAQQAVDYLARLIKATEDPDDRLKVTLRRARLLAEGLDDPEAAIEQYESVLLELDPKNEQALQAVAELEERRENPEGVANALERHLRVVATSEAKVGIAGRLADLYETRLDDLHAALRSLLVINSADPDDFEAIERITSVAERLEDWATVSDYLAMLIEVEGDEEELSAMTLRRAEILSDHLDRPAEGLKILSEIGDQGQNPCRDAFVELGDRLGKKAEVAAKLVEWYRERPPSPQRDEQLHGAYERYIEAGRNAEAAELGKDLARMRILNPSLAGSLESVSVSLKDLDALSIAHDLQIRELSGPARAEEMVRQAETLAKVGVDALEAIQHGEQALTSVGPDEVEALLGRLAALADGPGHVIDLYERQVGRCKAPQDRLAALARASQVAAEKGAMDRARGFFDLALGGGVKDEVVEALQDIAREADERAGGETLRRTLAEALAAGGQGARDGGRTRSAMLRRAALMTAKDLQDYEKALAWLGEALVTHVDDEGLDALDLVAEWLGEPQRADRVLSKALDEVFDGPLVRKLLARRAAVREGLGDTRGAAEDLKRLHDLSPSDTEVTDRLSALYTELEDYRGMVQLYEDQILRSRDQALRAELARKVAKLWEGELDDPREAADAWRRVLRMKSGDTEAQEGLERAKTNMNRPKAERVPAPEDAGAGDSSETEGESDDARGSSEVAAESDGPGGDDSGAPGAEEPSIDGADEDGAVGSDGASEEEPAPETAMADTVADGSPFGGGGSEDRPTPAHPSEAEESGVVEPSEALVREAPDSGAVLEGATQPSIDMPRLAETMNAVEEPVEEPTEETVEEATAADLEPSSPPPPPAPSTPPPRATASGRPPPLSPSTPPRPAEPATAISYPPPPPSRGGSAPPPPPTLSSRPPPPPPSGASRPPPPPPPPSGASRPPPPLSSRPLPPPPPSVAKRMPPPPPSIGSRRPPPPPPPGRAPGASMYEDHPSQATDVSGPPRLDEEEVDVDVDMDLIED